MDLFRTIWRAVRHHPARVAHPLRRRLALARLRKCSNPSTVLVLCLGNICRSPYAGASLRRRLNGGSGEVAVRSAGFLGAGRPPPPDAIQVASRQNVDLSSHRSRIITQNLVRAAELIVVMDPAHERALRQRFSVGPRLVVVLGDLDPEAIETRAIRDPLDQCLGVFEHTYARIDRCLDELAGALGKTSFQSGIHSHRLASQRSNRRPVDS